MGDELDRALILEALDIMGSLAAGDSGVKGAERTATQLDRFVLRVKEGKVLDVGEAAKNVVPVITRSDVPILTVEDVAELRSLDRSHHEEVLAVNANTLDGRDNVICVDVVDLWCDHDTLKDIGVCDGLLALVERREAMNSAHGDRKVLVAIILDLGCGE